jgi:hypothetical protein
MFFAFSGIIAGPAGSGTRHEEIAPSRDIAVRADSSLQGQSDITFEACFNLGSAYFRARECPEL